MKVIMVLFDTLNRHFLEPYGANEALTPNFTRLAQKTVRFQNCYAASLPCMPARREIHTGRYNFLHRSWGPMEPFDDSMPQLLKANGIHTHLVSDHWHYWSAGGATYHTQFSTWQNVRGQVGDGWQAVVDGVEDHDPNFVPFTEGMRGKLYQQNLVNRSAIKQKQDFPLVKTFDGGLDFLQTNHDRDNWFLQIESFAPHEPFMASDDFKELYPCDLTAGKKYEWPDYNKVGESQDVIDQVRYAYAACLSMCDEQLGRVLDLMDEKGLWEDTMLIVNTDHGFMLGEHDFWAKNYMPCYNEIAHLPLFVWDPRVGQQGTTCDALVQTIDLAPTILAAFELEATPDMQGKCLRTAMQSDAPIRRAGLYGVFGGHICCTDGRYTYMRAPRNTDEQVYEYTLMPTHMQAMFSPEELRTMQRHDGFDFTKGIPVMQIETTRAMRCVCKQDFLFDLSVDPKQTSPLEDEAVTTHMATLMAQLMRENDAPKELFVRFDLTEL